MVNWKTKIGFIFAAMGSAIGLGNIWRFPGIAYENGGGSFLIPYLIALLIVGIPLLLFEIFLGYYTKRAAPNAFAKIKKPLKFLGYLALFSGILVVSYYTVVIAWTLIYTLFALFDSVNPNLFGEIIKNGSLLFTGNITAVGLIYILSFFLVWILAYLITVNKVRGIEKFNLYAIPLMWFILIFLTIFTLFLPGSLKGVVQYLTPNFSALKDPKVWIAAFGQIFFSLSIGFGIMTAYAKYLKEHKAEKSRVIALGNSSFELLAGFMIFGALGFLITSLGLKSIEELSKKGFGYTSVNLSFKTIPVILSQVPLSYVLTILFFFLLFIAGITSLVSLIEAFVSAIEEDFQIERRKLLLVITALGFFSGLIYIYNINILDKVDGFVNYLLVFVGFLEAIVIGWMFETIKKSKSLFIKIGRFTAPIILGFILLVETIKRLSDYFEFLKPIKNFFLSSNNYFPPSEANAFTFIMFFLVAFVISWYLVELFYLIREEIKSKN